MGSHLQSFTALPQPHTGFQPNKCALAEEEVAFIVIEKKIGIEPVKSPRSK